MDTELVVAGPHAALATVTTAARSYQEASWSDRTRETYREQWAAFVRWCEQHAVCPLPATPSTVALYVSARAEQGRKPATLALALAAIAHAHEEAGLESPRAHRHVKQVMQGIRRKHGVAPAQKTPLLGEQLRTIARALPETTIGVRDRALLLVGFSGAFRRSELVGLQFADLDFTSEGLSIVLARSKTDQEGVGRKVPVTHGRAAATCPVRSLERWLELARITKGPVFRSVGRHGDVRGALSGRDVAAIVKRRVREAGLDPDAFAGHSLRAGLVTSAAKAGKPMHSIMKTTGHRSTAMIQRYIRDAQLFDDAACEGLL